MMKVVCSKCGMEYEDEESVRMATEMMLKGDVPCPILPCPGQLELRVVDDVVEQTGT